MNSNEIIHIPILLFDIVITSRILYNKLLKIPNINRLYLRIFSIRKRLRLSLQILVLYYNKLGKEIIMIEIFLDNLKKLELNKYS